MKKEIKERIKSFFIFLGVYLCFALIASIFVFPNLLEKYECTIKVKGTITKIKVEHDTDGNGKNKTYYFPIIEYEYKGNKYSSSPNGSSNVAMQGIHVGDEVTIYLDPNDYEHIYFSNNDKTITGGMIMFYIIIGLNILNILLLFIDIMRIRNGEEPLLQS